MHRVALKEFERQNTIGLKSYVNSLKVDFPVIFEDETEKMRAYVENLTQKVKQSIVQYQQNHKGYSNTKKHTQNKVNCSQGYMN